MATAIRGSKPEPPEILSPQIHPGQERVQVDHLASVLECVVPIQQDVAPSCRRHPGDQRHGLGVAAGLALRQQARQDGRVVVDDGVAISLAHWLLISISMSVRPVNSFFPPTWAMVERSW